MNLGQIIERLPISSDDELSKSLKGILRSLSRAELLDALVGLLKEKAAEVAVHSQAMSLLRQDPLSKAQMVEIGLREWSEAATAAWDDGDFEKAFREA